MVPDNSSPYIGLCQFLSFFEWNMARPIRRHTSTTKNVENMCPTDISNLFSSREAFDKSLIWRQKAVLNLSPPENNLL